MEKLVKNENITVIITTHYMDEADKLCNRVAIIDLGSIVAFDTPGNLKRKMGGDIVKLETTTTKIGLLKKLKFVKDVEVVGDTISITLQEASKHL